MARADGAESRTAAVQPAAMRPRPITPAAARDAPADDILAILEQTPKTEHRAALIRFVRRQVAAVLRRPDATDIPADQRLMDMGLDSLMAVELRNALTQTLRLPQSLPASLIFDHPSIADIAGLLFQRLHPPVAEARRPTIPRSRRTAVQLAALSDADVEKLLTDKLEYALQDLDEARLDRSA
jgi:acyl carrier protein